ncbi:MULTISPECIES: MarR family winged helix-turn-helix transcriptional regulator [Streptomyces]|uniref:MarR family winged helix-turn-helix transcriptional regulator n=1 Tax=Streptomyces TaxID=1883 RepID=UPI00030AE475|nr:MarR family winged helix-turn-helix transcriptional regulator [Streptomyces sp. 604F]QPA00076.1 transposase [Streptomyces violascens]UYM24606.1 MarR family winged helix-turn-helix transcriptional regulator [Streptomyces albus]WDV31994.1 MarR family winged helix-turn-helix transcriptional regulator [Streptomyces sp. AD16]MBP3078265.1 transposase [Streptomyces sp. 604F]QHV86614.1 transposase [Streptomyces sp. 604F]
MTVDAQYTDEELAAQPVPYWTKLAYEATIGFVRRKQAEVGFTQPRFWVLRFLSVNDLSEDGQGRSVEELRSAMVSFLRPEDDLAAEAEVLLASGWVTRDGDGRLWITEAGDAARLDLKARAPEWRVELHDGITDAEYATALRVLMRLMRNTGATVPAI